LLRIFYTAPRESNVMKKCDKDALFAHRMKQSLFIKIIYLSILIGSFSALTGCAHHYENMNKYLLDRMQQLGAIEHQMGNYTASGSSQYIGFLLPNDTPEARNAEVVVDCVDFDSNGGVTIASSKRMKVSDMPPKYGLKWTTIPVGVSP
jgi:hypothetical protein